MPDYRHLTPDSIKLVRRWSFKRELYGFDHITESVDRMFTAYVIYNHLYNSLNQSLQYGISGDRNKAISVIPKFLGKDLFSDKIVISLIKTLREIHLSGQFYFKNINWDLEKFRQLELEEEPRIEAALEILYTIRCNLFHGEKDLQPSQCMILRVATQIYERVADISLEKCGVQIPIAPPSDKKLDWIYFAHIGDDIYKIGWANNIDERITKIKADYELREICVYDSFTVTSGFYYEQSIHRLLSDYRLSLKSPNDKYIPEIFNLSEIDVKQFIMNLKVLRPKSPTITLDYFQNFPYALPLKHGEARTLDRDNPLPRPLNSKKQLND